MYAKVPRIMLVILGAAGTLYLGWHLREFHQIDKCLDHGGCWVYPDQRCEFKNQAECDAR